MTQRDYRDNIVDGVSFKWYLRDRLKRLIGVNLNLRKPDLIKQKVLEFINKNGGWEDQSIIFEIKVLKSPQGWSDSLRILVRF